MKVALCTCAVAWAALLGGAASAQPAAGAAGSAGSAGPGSLPTLPLDAAAPEVSAAAGPSELVLGGKFTLYVTAAFDPGVEVNLREPVDLGPAFEVRRHVSADRPRADGKRVREWQLEVYAWDVGDLHVPPVAVTFTAAGHAGQVETAPVPLRVTSSLGDAAGKDEMRPNAPPIALVHPDWRWLWIAAGGAALLVVGATAVWARRRSRLRVVTLVGGAAATATVAPVRMDMTAERALERLLAIERSGVLARDADRKAGYATMATVVREYTGTRFGAATAELTTGELVRTLARLAPASDVARVEAWLARCDLVKYGGVRASEADATDVLAAAREVVLATTGAAGARGSPGALATAGTGTPATPGAATGRSEGT